MAGSTCCVIFQNATFGVKCLFFFYKTSKSNNFLYGSYQLFVCFVEHMFRLSDLCRGRVGSVLRAWQIECAICNMKLSLEIVPACVTERE